MDPSYTDPNKPAFIKDYDYIDNKIYLVSHDGIETVLTGPDYNDDKWVSADDGKKYNNVIIPEGYVSIFKVYEYVEQVSNFSNKKKNKSADKYVNIDTEIGSILESLENCLSNGVDNMSIQYYDSPTHFNVFNIKMVSDQYGAGYIFSRRSQYDDSYSITFGVGGKDPEFASVMNRLLDNGLDRLASLNLLKFIPTSSFGYGAINKITSMARDSKTYAIIITFSIIDIYAIEYDENDNMVHATAMDVEDIKDIDHPYAMAFLGTEESVDLDNKVQSAGGSSYECFELMKG